MAVLVGTPLFVILLLADTLGDCFPGTVCHKSFLSFVLLPTAAIAVPLFLVVRALVNWLRKPPGAS